MLLFFLFFLFKYNFKIRFSYCCKVKNSILFLSSLVNVSTSLLDKFILSMLIWYSSPDWCLSLPSGSFYYCLHFAATVNFMTLIWLFHCLASMAFYPFQGRDQVLYMPYRILCGSSPYQASFISSKLFCFFMVQSISHAFPLCSSFVLFLLTYSTSVHYLGLSTSIFQIRTDNTAVSSYCSHSPLFFSSDSLSLL